MSAEADDHSIQPTTRSLAEWMGQHRDELRILVDLGAFSWPDFASAFAQAGYQDTVGRPITSRAAEFLWRTVDGAQSPEH